ncbi:MAG: hypothetical protein RMN52_17260 [Anaerolineae bacterium]|nr:hypothetical protein [Candidatus Roseilinea sp.]MDW8451747.1 hypothetical protein [Anaerolineae bacterium]
MTTRFFNHEDRIIVANTFARAGCPEQRGVAVAGVQAGDERFDRLRLIAGRLKGGMHLELWHGRA